MPLPGPKPDSRSGGLKSRRSANDRGIAANPTIQRPLGGRRRVGRLAPYRRERREFGGRIQWEAGFFGLLAGVGLAASLTAMVLGGLIAAGASDFGEHASSLVVLVAVALVVPLVFAVLGGVLGERFHRAVDRVGFEPEPESEVRRKAEPEPETAEEDEESRPEVAR